MGLIRREALAGVVHRAVERSLKDILPGADARMRPALESRLRREILAAMRAGSRPIRGLEKSEFLRELERSRDLVLLRRQRARDELRHWVSMAEVYRSGMQKSKRSLSERAAESARAHDQETGNALMRLFGRAKRGEVDLAELEAKTLQLALGALREERERVDGERDAQHAAEVELFKRRILKLTSSLERTEDAIKSLRQLEGAGAAAVDLGSLQRIVQGLDFEEDDSAEAKRSMMEILFQANLALRRELAA